MRRARAALSQFVTQIYTAVAHGEELVETAGVQESFYEEKSKEITYRWEIRRFDLPGKLRFGIVKLPRLSHRSGSPVGLFPI